MVIGCALALAAHGPCRRSSWRDADAGSSTSLTSRNPAVPGFGKTPGARRVRAGVASRRPCLPSRLATILIPTNRRDLSWRRVGPEEEVAEGLPPMEGHMPASAMLRAIVKDMAALAPCREVGVGVDARVVVPMRRREVDLRPADHRGDLGRARLRAELSAAPITPSAGLGVPPPAVPQVQDDPAVRSAALLAQALRAAEPDHSGELRPIDRVEKTVLGLDRHGLGLWAAERDWPCLLRLGHTSR